MFESIGKIAGAGPHTPRRTHQPVHRHSRPAGRCEGVFWRRIDQQEAAKIRLAAEKYERVTREKGARSGALGSVALEVINYLTRLVDRKTGRLDPSIDHLMRTLKRSRDAIVRALAALRTHGFLDWLRRFEPTGIEGRGPQVRQVSNAYRLSLPRRALALLGRYFQPVPVPDDHSAAQAAWKADYETQRAALSEVERTRLDVDPDDPLGAALLRMAQARAARKERESVRQTES